MKEKLEIHAEILENVDLTKYNTFHIASKCKYLVLPNSVQDLVEVIKYLKENDIKYFILGNGSNIVLNDDLKDLVVIKLSKLQAIDVHPHLNMVYAEAGAMLPKVAFTSIEEGLTGLEFATGIPGSVGGSIVGNAGAYNCCILDYVKSVTIIDKDNNLVTLDHEDIKYGYRTTMFKENKDAVIVSVKFYLKDGDKEESLNVVENRKQRRMESQPLDVPSAGSVFRNPEGDSAWHLIDECGLKGHSIGGAQVSLKHANFIVNNGNATGCDVRKLINYVHDEVKNKMKVDLQIEQEFIGWE